MKPLQWIEKLLLTAAMLLLVTLLVLVFTQIVARNIFGFSFIFIEELALILLSWCAFLSAAYTYRKRGHVAVEFFYDKLPQRAQWLVNIVTLICILAFLIYIIHYGWGLSSRQMRILTPVMSIPRGWLFLSLPVSCTFMSLFVVADIIKVWRERRPVGAKESLETFKEQEVNT